MYSHHIVTGLHIWYVHSAYEMVWAVKHNQIYILVVHDRSGI